MSEPRNHHARCLVVGGGLAGLACARELVRAGREVLVVEAKDRVGGRVATDTLADGFRVDRGFQVFNDAYPEGIRQLDLPALGLGRFAPGALVAEGARLRRLTDPWRRPWGAVAALLDGSVGLGDALRMARLRSDALRALATGRLNPDGPGSEAERSTRAELMARGFSPGFISRFFEPFFGGVFLERQLETSADVFLFDFAMFARGSACLPRGGMESIPRQMAASLPPGTVQLGTPVERVEAGRLRLRDGGEVHGAVVVVATDGAAAARLLPAEQAGNLAQRAWKSTRLLAFAAERSPLGDPTILVNAAEQGPIDSVVVPSDVAEGYAPAGRSLVTISVGGGWPDGDEGLVAAVRSQAATWFGAAVSGWHHLATVRVEHALPDESPGARRLRRPPGSIAPGLFLAAIIADRHRSTAPWPAAGAARKRC